MSASKPIRLSLSDTTSGASTAAQSNPGSYPIENFRGSLALSGDWVHDEHRGYGKCLNWGEKYIYGAFSSLMAAYVIGYEFHGKLAAINAWKENPQAADQLIAKIWQRYCSLKPKEVAAIVRLSNANELGEIFRSHPNVISTPEANLDFMENTMANYLGSEKFGVDTSRMDKHSSNGVMRQTLEPVSKRWQHPDAASFDTEMHRGAYATAFGIAQNSILAYLAGYIAGDRVFETDVLDAKDLIAIIAHEFALNSIRGEYYSPISLVSNLTAAEIGESYYGIVDPDQAFPNARKTAFNVKTLKNMIGFFDRYLPDGNLSLDARNMSSVTSIIELAEHYSAAPMENSPLPRKLATVVKLYPFLLGHGFDQALAEFVVRLRGNTGIGFEELKYWVPSGYNPERSSPDHRTGSEKQLIELRNSTDDPDGKDRSVLAKIAAMAPPTEEERAAFMEALRHIPLVLAVGGIVSATAAPDSTTAEKGIRHQFTKEDYKLTYVHEGSNSVLNVSNLTLDDEDELWHDKLLFGGAEDKEDISIWEEELDRHNIPLFNEFEREQIRFNTLKLFQWIASFIPHIHPKSTIQFAARPSLTEILQEIRAMNLLRELTGHLNLDQGYLDLNSLEKSSVKNRLTLLESAVIDNVRELIRLIGKGEIDVETYSNDSKGGNQAEVRKAFKEMKYAAFDRYSDFSLKAEETEGDEVKGDYIYFVVEGRIKAQDQGHANQTGQLRHTPYWVSRSTTDLAVEFKQIYHHLALHRVRGMSLPYPFHIIHSRRSLLVRPYSEQDPKPRGIAWGGWDKAPSKEELEEKLKDVLKEIGLTALGPYLEAPGRKDLRREKRFAIVRKVTE